MSITDECIEWDGALNRKGYGLGGQRGRELVHKLAWEESHGPVPEGHQLHHVCENPPCFLVDHLRPVTPDEHADLTPSHHRHRTHCPQGHPFDEANTLRRKDRRGRECRACRREAVRRHRARVRS